MKFARNCCIFERNNKTSRYRIGTEFSPLTGFTVPANPNVIELVHGLLNNCRIIGKDACLEIALVVRLHTDAGTSEVCTADIGHLAIEYQDFEMHSRTECPFKTVEQNRVFIEVFAEGRAGFFGVDKTDFHSFLDQLCQNRKEWLCLCADLDLKVFDVSSANPKASLHLGDTGEDFGVMGGIGN